MANLATRYVYLNTETTYGTDPGGSSQLYGEVDDESFQQNFDIVLREDMSSYSNKQAFEGFKHSTGDVNFAFIADDFCGKILDAIYGVDTTTGTNPYTHTFTETVDEATLPTFTIGVGRDSKEHLYKGCVLDTFSIGANINEYVMASASFVGNGEASTTTLKTPSFSTLDAMHFGKAYVRFEATASSSSNAAMIKSFNLEFNRNRDVDNGKTLGNESAFQRAPPPQRFEISGSIEFYKPVYTAVDNEPTYDELRAGLQVDGTFSSPAISIHLEDEGAATLNIALPKVQYGTPTSTISGRDAQVMSVDFTVIYDVSESGCSKCILVNTQSSDYDSL